MTELIHPVAIKKMISYYYLVAFCPPAHVKDLKKASQKMRTGLTKLAGLKMKEFTAGVIPEVARRMVAFQQATREPDQETVDQLSKALKSADSSPKKAAAYQGVMKSIAIHPGRAKMGNRLHRNKGCKYCQAPCQYGFFSLISEPDFKSLLAMLGAENKKIAAERNPVNVLWTYTTAHLWKTLEAQQGFISADHLGNLSYCLLMLGTAKSRLALPEAQLTRYQELNQNTIRSWRPAEIKVVDE